MVSFSAELASLRALFDSFPAGVLVANDEGCYLAANSAACELLGRRREELIGAHLADIVADGRKHVVEAQWQAFLRDGAQSGAFTVVLPDGQSRRLHFHAEANFVPGLHCSYLNLDEEADSDPAKLDGKPLLTMCAWTKQVRSGDRWVSIERYLDESHGILVSHGICPKAARRWFGDGNQPAG